MRGCDCTFAEFWERDSANWRDGEQFSTIDGDPNLNKRTNERLKMDGSDKHEQCDNQNYNGYGERR